MKTRTRMCALFLLSALLIMITACEFNSRGAGIYQSQRCKDCHTLKGKGGSVGPNLTYVGGKRTREYIVQQIKDPKSHNPNTDMPSFRDKLSDQQIGDLADYLSGLK